MNPHFFDALKTIVGATTDTELSKELGFSPSYIKNVRVCDKAPAKFEIAVQEATNWTLWEMREKMREGV